MSRLHDIWKALAGTPAQREPTPITKIVSGGTENNPLLRMGLSSANSEDPLRQLEDRIKWVRIWKRIYTWNGGAVAEAIDTYPLLSLSNGYQFVCEEGAEALKDKVQEWADQGNVDLDSIMWQGIIDALVCGTAFQEIIPDASGSVWGVVPRDAASFWIRYDALGRIIGYDQITFEGGVPHINPIDTSKNDRILTLTLFPIPGEVYGMSLIGRAYDDILRDTDIIESMTKAMHRHGTPKQQWDIGTPENPATETELKDVEKTIRTVNSMTDFCTSNVKINMLDTSGVPGITEYNNVTTTRLATSLGVPEEMLGLGRGSTEATANVRLRAFYDKITTIQTIVARTYSRKVIDLITGAPGKVWIEFNDPNPEDEAKKAAWIASIMMASGMDPFRVMPRQWVQEQFGISPEEYPDEPGQAREKLQFTDQIPPFPRENEAPSPAKVERTDAYKESEQKLAAANTIWARKIIEAVERDYPVR